MTQQIPVSSIKLLVLDVDGVMTTGSIAYSSSSDGTIQELKQFNVKDGLAISLANRSGLPVAIITARQSKIVEHRAEELGIKHLFQGAKTKLPVLQELCQTLNLELSQVAYMGDDLPDIPALKAVGLPTCPADAAKQVLPLCQWVSKHPGGTGAIRELLEYLIPEAFEKLS